MERPSLWYMERLNMVYTKSITMCMERPSPWSRERTGVDKGSQWCGWREHSYGYVERIKCGNHHSAPYVQMIDVEPWRDQREASLQRKREGEDLTVTSMWAQKAHVILTAPTLVPLDSLQKMFRYLPEEGLVLAVLM